ncbi:MAG: response regulator transcription factor [Chromatiales bacterium]|jgi:two-component system response regulator PhoP|nr:response regulator transcription factor [Chromatiales bacterium]MDH3930994.1 response regulator transcription factor [Chromatiales bacterium]MDH3945192.1 response regulator transcription factor [Chromatiales bacterium]MDH4013937.1 response regulator transcription factor [Chromatiales bacterium]PLX57789.1 MAG: DNA-binding response regulator [Chromatiales bacterium]
MRLLVVEDEQALRSTLAEQFADQGFIVDAAGDGVEGLYFATEYPIDLAIVDLGLPELPGMELIRRMRAAGKTCPVLILTARGQWQEKVEGLQAGADDYVVKPFHFEEVLARVQALLRRSGGWADAVLRSGTVSLDTRSQQVSVGGENVDLTSFEYRMLECLMLSAGKVMSKAELTDRLYNQDFERDSNTIEVFIRRLRKKLDPDNMLQPIETLRGRGYRWNLEKSA